MYVCLSILTILTAGVVQLDSNERGDGGGGVSAAGAAEGGPALLVQNADLVGTGAGLRRLLGPGYLERTIFKLDFVLYGLNSQVFCFMPTYAEVLFKHRIEL